MTRQPYTYTMPEEFLSDVGVPARWKVLATVQGFWIAGKTVYATNEWLQTKLGYERRQVQNALAELEEMGLVARNIQGMNRLIMPGGCTQNARGGAPGVRVGGAVGVHHNSDSISDSKTSVAIAPQEVYEAPSEESPKKPAAKQKYPHSKEVFALWPSAPKNWALNTTQLRAAENLFEERGMDEIKNALTWFLKHKDDEFCPQVNTPYDLDSKWVKLEAFVDKL